MIKIKATPQFIRQSEKAMSAEAQQELIDHLAVYPDSGAIIQGTGGVRKIRWKTGKIIKVKAVG